MPDKAWMLSAPAWTQPVARESPGTAPRAQGEAARLAPSASQLDTTRPVLIIDGGSSADLGLVRSLGFAKIPVHLLTSGRASVTTQSRYVTQTHAFPHSGASDEECVARIRAVAKSLRLRPVILASGDWALQLLSRCRADVADVVDHDLHDAQTISNFSDKAQFARIAERLSRLALKGWTPSDREFVAGSDGEVVSVHVYVEPSGRILGSFTASEAKVSPPDAGVGTAVTSRRNEQLAALAVAIVNKLEYSGFAILQFQVDAHTDAFQLIEVNCRYGAWTELPSRCGCNFPVAAYATITEQPAPVLAQREGVRCWAFFALEDPAPFFWQMLQRKPR